jgi:plasmid stabilization system protein ParE
MKKVIWTPTARKSLRQTSDFITELWNQQVTNEFLNQLDFRIVQVQKNPELAPTFENSEFRQLLIHKSTSLFYRDFSDSIKLLLVWDNRQNPAELLDKLTNTNDNDE